ncbi:MAG: VWA domain-containing protein [Vicinamibacteraceae bacterium]
MRRAVSIAVVALSMASAPEVRSQDRLPRQTSQPAFRAGVDLISLNVTVTDSARRFVTTLDQQDFLVLEDGHPQAVTFFMRTGLPVTVAIVVDTSASMAGALATAQESAIGFVRRLRPDDRAAVVDFDSRVRILQSFTSDQPALERAIRSTIADGSTALYNAVYISLNELTKLARSDIDAPGRRAIVLLSDGEDTSSLMNLEEVLDAANRSDTAIYTIGLGERDAQGRLAKHDAEFALRRLAQQTGGRSFFPNDLNQLAGIYNEITNELASQYALAYASSNGRRDGQWRRISIRLAQRDLAARTKPGYFGPR